MGKEIERHLYDSIKNKGQSSLNEVGENHQKIETTLSQIKDAKYAHMRTPHYQDYLCALSVKKLKRQKGDLELRFSVRVQSIFTVAEVHRISDRLQDVEVQAFEQDPNRCSTKIRLRLRIAEEMSSARAREYRQQHQQNLLQKSGINT
jgi:hypothetical protein